MSFSTALFLAVLLAAGCTPDMEKLSPEAARGKELFKKKQCHTCHNTDDTEKIGPGLEGDARRHSEEWLARWLADPEAVWKEGAPETEEMKKRLGRAAKSSTRMKLPKPLKKEEIRYVIDYLKTL